jgi:uncharacterized protein (DUF305 family)
MFIVFTLPTKPKNDRENTRYTSCSWESRRLTRGAPAKGLVPLARSSHMRAINLAAVFALIAMVSMSTAQVGSSDSEQHASRTSAAREMTSGDMQKHMEMVNQMMVKRLGKSDAEYDARFIDMMIPHHEGAILMAKDALKNARHPEMKSLATKIIKAQQKEIDQLKSWRKDWYGDASENTKESYVK